MEFRTQFRIVRNFCTLFRTVRKLAWDVRNATRVPGGCFAQCENFRTLNSGVRNWRLENSHLGLWFSHVGMNFTPWIEVCEIFAPWFALCENWLKQCEMTLVCQEGVSHGAKIFAPWIVVCEILLLEFRTLKWIFACWIPPCENLAP